MLSGCATSGSRPFKATLPPLPADLLVCFDKTVPAPKGPLTKSQVVKLIASLKLSEAEKIACGNRLIAFYESLTT